MKNYIKSLTDGLEHNWEIVMLRLQDIKDPALFDAEYELSTLNKPANRKLKTLLRLIKKRKPLPPIIVSRDNVLRDGTHRLSIYRLFNRKRLTVLRYNGKGNGKVIGKYPGKSTYPYKGLTEEGVNFCIDCKERVKYVGIGQKAGTISTFPHGLPNGPFWYCESCGYHFKRNFCVWK